MNTTLLIMMLVVTPICLLVLAVKPKRKASTGYPRPTEPEIITTYSPKSGAAP